MKSCWWTRYRFNLMQSEFEGEIQFEYSVIYLDPESVKFWHTKSFNVISFEKFKSSWTRSSVTNKLLHHVVPNDILPPLFFAKPFRYIPYGYSKVEIRRIEALLVWEVCWVWLTSMLFCEQTTWVLKARFLNRMWCKFDIMTSTILNQQRSLYLQVLDTINFYS